MLLVRRLLYNLVVHIQRQLENKIYNRVSAIIVIQQNNVFVV